MPDFKDRRVLLTGAAGGLGKPLAEALQSRGARLVMPILPADSCGMTSTAHQSIIEVDLTDRTALETAIQREIAADGPIDTVINNAAIYPKSLIAELEVEEMLRVYEVNVAAAALLTRLCTTGMRERGFGRVINIASITFDIGMVELSSYVATKASLIGLARVWARELGPDNITVNAVSPGAFQTDAEKIHPDPDRYNRFVLDQQALKRRGTPDDFANLVMFLMSDAASFITGQNIRVDGGWVTV